MTANKETIFDLSIVVPSYNQAGYVANLLQSLQDQVTEFLYEVILVDSGDDLTVDIVREKFPWVKVIKLHERAYPGKGRNIGVANSQGKKIAFTDCDCTVSPDWVDNIVKGLDKVPILTGPVRNGTPWSIWGTLDYLLELYDFFDHEADKKTGAVGSGNLAFRIDIFEKFGPMDEGVKGSDARFTRRVLDDLQSISWNENVSIHHHNRTKIKKILKNQYELGKGAVLTSARQHKYGAILLKYPVLIPFIPLVRSIRIGRILFKKSMSNFVKFVLLYPFILIGLSAYAVGFWRGMGEQKKQIADRSDGREN